MWGACVGATGSFDMARVRHALLWQIALFQYGGPALIKSFHLGAKWALPCAHFYIDTSPWEYGAFLTWDSSPIEYLAGGWTEGGLNRFDLKLGDARGQTVWEALAILIELRCWWVYWKDQLVVIRAKSDSKAALGALEKQRSSAPSVNAVARELALDRALSTCEPLLEFAHVRGVRNEWADALSRLHQPGSNAVVPGPLRVVTRQTVPARVASWWRTAGDTVVL